MANEVYTRSNQPVFLRRLAIDPGWGYPRSAQVSGSPTRLSQVRYHREHCRCFHFVRGVLAVAHEVADRYR